MELALGPMLRPTTYNLELEVLSHFLVASDGKNRASCFCFRFPVL